MLLAACAVDDDSNACIHTSASGNMRSFFIFISIFG